MSKIKQILDPILNELSSVERAILVTSDWFTLYDYTKKGLETSIDPNLLKTLLIIIYGLTDSLKEEPQFFIGEMKNKNFAIIFFDKFSFIILLKSTEELGYIRFQLGELKGKLEKYIKNLEKDMKLKIDHEFKIPSEKDIDKILEEFSFVEN